MVDELEAKLSKTDRKLRKTGKAFFPNPSPAKGRGMFVNDSTP
ncbi:hypothetical protein [Lysinibacillus xylanilyticus]